VGPGAPPPAPPGACATDADAVWDGATARCRDLTPAECAAKYLALSPPRTFFNAGARRCEAATVCSGGESYDGATNACRALNGPGTPGTGGNGTGGGWGNGTAPRPFGGGGGAGNITCVHGAANATTGLCDCDAGWSTSVRREAGAFSSGPTVMCNSSARTTPSVNGEGGGGVGGGNLLNLLLSPAGLVLLGVLLLLLVCCCCCCCKFCCKKKKEADSGAAVEGVAPVPPAGQQPLAAAASSPAAAAASVAPLSRASRSRPSFRGASAVVYEI
jgi:hypothetical protein